MTTFNVVFTGDPSVLVTYLKAQGITGVTVFQRSKVLQVVANDAKALVHPNIKLVEEEKTVTPQLQAVWQQLRLTTVDLPLSPLYSAVFDGAGQVIYLVDTGVDTSHPELTPTLVNQLWSFDGSAGDTLGHGTILATLIAGKTIGISPKVFIKSVKIDTGKVNVSTLVSALEAILADHEQTPNQAKVVNCSWLIEKSQVLDTVISSLEAAGLVVVAAAGNSGVAANTFSPVGLDSVLGVGACDAYDRVIAWGTGDVSNFGPEVDITAPGIDVVTIDKTGAQGKLSGTSVAAAITSAVVAQFIQSNPSISATAVQAALLDHALQEFLFRNESIYSTTPNRLLHTLSTTDVGNFAWGVQRPCVVNVQLNTATRLAIPFKSPITSVNAKGFKWPDGSSFYMPSWVTFDAEKKVFYFVPPQGLAPGKYPFFLEGLDAQNKQYILPVLALVYKDSVSEVTANTTEQYLNESGAWVTVHLEFCVQDSDCQPPSYRFCNQTTHQCDGFKA